MFAAAARRSTPRHSPRYRKCRCSPPIWCTHLLDADRVAAAAGEVLLCEAAPRVRTGVAARFAKNAKIRAVVPDEVERLPEHSLDLIVLHSVAQYLRPEETAALFAHFHRMLKFDDLLVVSDILSPHVGALTTSPRSCGSPHRMDFHRRRCRARAHADVRLLAPAHTPRTDPVRRSGNVGKSCERPDLWHTVPAKTSATTRRARHIMRDRAENYPHGLRV
jgi:hypothetical protein